MSELLERIQREIRERLEASRAAVREHERLEAVLHALSDAGSRATRAVTGGGRDTRAPARSAPKSSSSRKRAGAAARSSRQAAAAGSAKRTASAGRGERGATAAPRRRSGAAAGGRHKPSSSATGAAASAGTKKTRRRATSAATPARNRAAVLRVIDERPGVSARELAEASGVTGGTLYTLLRRLSQEGTVEKRELPGGQTGYAIAASGACQVG